MFGPTAGAGLGASSAAGARGPAAAPAASSAGGSSSALLQLGGHPAPAAAPLLLDVLPALYQCIHPEFARLVGLSRDFYHNEDLLSATDMICGEYWRSCTRFHAAVKRNDRARAAELLAACSTPNKRRMLLAGRSFSPLFDALDGPMVELLLGAGANVWVRYSPQQPMFNHTTFELAAVHGRLGAFRALLAATGSEEARKQAVISTLRRGVHDANVAFRACHMNISLLFHPDYHWYDGEPPAGVQVACIPTARSATHRRVQLQEGIGALELLSAAELGALVTPADEAAERKFLKGQFRMYAAFLCSNEGMLDHTQRNQIWVTDCVEGLQTALFALEAGAPLSTPVPARMTPEDDCNFDDGDHSRDQPTSAWLQAHAAWFGPPLVTAALARWTSTPAR